MSFWQTILIAGVFIFVLFVMVFHSVLETERETKKKDIQAARRVLCEYCNVKYKCTELDFDFCTPGKKLKNEILED